MQIKIIKAARPEQVEAEINKFAMSDEVHRVLNMRVYPLDDGIHWTACVIYKKRYPENGGRPIVKVDPKLESSAA